MGTEIWTAIGVIVGAFVTLIGAILMLPKIRAEARKTNAEASRTEWQNLSAEIGRLDREIRELRRERDGADKENRLLRGEVRRLTRRVEGLENILRARPITPEMQAMLDELDRKTAGGGHAK